MNHVLTLIYLLGLMTGTAGILLLFLTYHRSGQKIFRTLLLFFSLINFWTICRIVQHYIEVSVLSNLYNLFLPQNFSIFIVFFILQIILFFWGLIFTISAAGTIHQLSDRTWGGIQKAVLTSAAFLFPFSAILAFLPYQSLEKSFYTLSLIHSYFFQPLLFAFFVYCFVFLAASIRKISDRRRKSSVFAVTLILGFFLPWILIEMFFPRRMPGVVSAREIFMTLFFFSLNIAAIGYVFQFFSNILFLPRSADLPNDFILKFNISKRETEIVALLLEQKTYEKIAEHLFISIKTVETHVLHIYQKAGVKSREDLIHKIGSMQ